VVRGSEISPVACVYFPRMAAIAFLRPTRAEFRNEPTADEMEALGRHFAFLQGMVA